MKKTKLTKLQRKKLLSAHKLKENVKFAGRIKTILLLDKGWPASLISKALFIDERTVRNYKKSYDEGGLEYLITDGYKGRPTKLSSSQEKKLSQYLEDKPYLYIKDIVFYVKKTYKVTYSQSGMRDLLYRLKSSKKP